MNVFFVNGLCWTGIGTQRQHDLAHCPPNKSSQNAVDRHQDDVVEIADWKRICAANLATVCSPPQVELERGGEMRCSSVNSLIP
jgi:hypothetical protein